MARRGPKAQTPAKRRAGRGGAAIWQGWTLPADVSPEVETEYHRLVRNVRAVGTIDRTDPQMVLAAAKLQALLDKATAELLACDDQGVPKRLTEAASNGTPMPHPMIGVVNMLTQRLRGYWADMGLTPKTKHGNPQPAEEESRWSGLLGVTG